MTRLLLDTSSLAYRAFFALPTSITDEEGRPVNAVRGYLDMTARLVSTRRPREVLHVYDDDWRPAPRVAAYPAYKSQRAPDPEDLPAQFDLLRQVLDALGAWQAWAPGWEADDAIAVLCTPENGLHCEIVTGDRDLLQLVRDGAVTMLYTVRGVTQLVEFDEATVREHYGVPPQRYADFAILRGDPSDGLPGVTGVGDKTARALVAAYPDLDALLADADAQRPRLAEQLRSARGYLAAMREVVPVRADVPVEVRRPQRDDGRLDALAERHRLQAPVGRLRAALEAAAGENP